jgi:hypothetical protein
MTVRLCPRLYLSRLLRDQRHPSFQFIGALFCFHGFPVKHVYFTACFVPRADETRQRIRSSLIGFSGVHVTDSPFRRCKTSQEQIPTVLLVTTRTHGKPVVYVRSKCPPPWPPRTSAPPARRPVSSRAPAPRPASPPCSAPQAPTPSESWATRWSPPRASSAPGIRWRSRRLFPKTPPSPSAARSSRRRSSGYVPHPTRARSSQSIHPHVTLKKSHTWRRTPIHHSLVALYPATRLTAHAPPPDPNPQHTGCRRDARLGRDRRGRPRRRVFPHVLLPLPGKSTFPPSSLDRR